jgi:hypothetical protein
VPIYNIEDSKFVVETISIVEDFSEELLGGDLITGTPTITVTLLTGIDPSPSLILYGGVSILGGKVVEQRFRQGIPGCIYTIVYTAQTVQGFEYLRERVLAVLPLEGNATPKSTSLYESSCFYPYELVESLKGSQILQSGTLRLATYSYFDGMQSSQLLTGGTYVNVVVSYNYGLDSLKGSQILTGGLLTSQSFISYSYHEDLKGQQILVSGTLVSATLITYSYDIDSLKGTQLLTGGTLT